MKEITFASDGLSRLIDPRSINDFYKDLKIMYDKFVASAATISLWANYSGGGLYTLSGAKIAKGMFLKAIDTEGASIGQRWPELSHTQLEMADISAGYGTHWKDRGNVYRNIVARKDGRGYTVGLKDKMVNSSGFRTAAKGTRRTAKISVKRYAAWVEYGTSWQKPRPLFGPVATVFTAKAAPGLNRIVEKSVKKIADKYKMEKLHTSTQTKSMGSMTSAYSMQSANPNEDFSAQVMNDLLIKGSMGADGISIPKGVGKTATSNIKLVADVVEEDFDKLVAELQLSGNVAFDIDIDDQK